MTGRAASPTGGARGMSALADDLDRTAECPGCVRGADVPLHGDLRREIVELLAAALVADFLSNSKNSLAYGCVPVGTPPKGSEAA